MKIIKVNSVGFPLDIKFSKELFSKELKIIREFSMYDSKGFYIDTKKYTDVTNSFISFELSIHQRISITVSTKILSSSAVHNNNKKCFLSTKSVWFLKDHVTLKTGVMML